MKRNKKGLIALMLAGVMAVGIGSLGGCGNGQELGENTEIRGSKATIATNLVVALYEKKVTLHKGNVYTLDISYGKRGIASTNQLELKCGKRVITDQFVGYPDDMPEEDSYDIICPNCFAN